MSDNVRDEFLAEAQEIIESLSRDLLLLDQAQKDAGGDPDLVAALDDHAAFLRGASAG